MEKRQKRKVIIIGVLILVLTNVLTFMVATGSSRGLSLGRWVVLPVKNQEMADELRKLVSLKNIIDDEFYQDVDQGTLFTGAYTGLFEALDDEYSGYYTPEEFAGLMASSKGSYQGIGVVVTEDDNGLTTVVTPYKNTPAAEAGIQIGDKIIKVNDEDVTAKGMNYVVSKMKGDPGTDVKVTVLRGEEELDFNLKRQNIDIPTVESEVIDGVGYIAVTEFTQQTGEDFTAQFNALKEQNISGLVIDLRYNGGGIIDSAVDIAGHFMGEEVVVYTVDKHDKRTDYRGSKAADWQGKTVVLVNEGSASAAEILAGALQDTHGATLVGTTTFGKGIVQEVVPLTDGSGYKLTKAEYFTPKGRNIQGKGLEPDVILELPAEYQKSVNVPRDQDNQLQRALELAK